MTKPSNSPAPPRRFHDNAVAVRVAAPLVLTLSLATGCGSDSGLFTGSPDGGLDQKGSSADVIIDTTLGPPDVPLLDVPPEGPVSDDGGSCQVPNVWRYQAPGCGTDAHPVCGSAVQDAGLGFACGCDGETLVGFDYFPKPWATSGPCPDACFSPTHNLAIATVPSLFKGCACDSATDGTQCVFASGMHPMSCVGGAWQLDIATFCSRVDAGCGGPDANAGCATPDASYGVDADACGDSCGGTEANVTCATPIGSSGSGAGACSDGEIWITSVMAHFNAFCGKPCETTGDCPPGMVCVTADMTADYPGPVCVSDQVPQPKCSTGMTHLEGPQQSCEDSQTMGTMYVNDRTGIAGWELTTCPNGCQGGGPDGGVWGKTPGSCR